MHKRFQLGKRDLESITFQTMNNMLRQEKRNYTVTKAS